MVRHCHRCGFGHHDSTAAFCDACIDIAKAEIRAKTRQPGGGGIETRPPSAGGPRVKWLSCDAAHGSSYRSYRTKQYSAEQLIDLMDNQNA